jgi:hypothetical protein
MRTQGTVRFTVYGENHAALTEAAYERLRNYLPPGTDVGLEIDFDVSPSVRVGTGEVLSWEAQVTARWSDGR